MDQSDPVLTNSVGPILYTPTAVNEGAEHESRLVAELRAEIVSLQTEVRTLKTEQQKQRRKQEEQEDYIRKCEDIMQAEIQNNVQCNKLIINLIALNELRRKYGGKTDRLPEKNSITIGSSVIRRDQLSLPSISKSPQQQQQQSLLLNRLQGGKVKTQSNVASGKAAAQTVDKRFQVTEEMLDSEFLSPWEAGGIRDDSLSIRPIQSNRIEGVDQQHPAQLSPEKGFLSDQRNRIKSIMKSSEQVHTFIPKVIVKRAIGKSEVPVLISQQQQLSVKVAKQKMIHQEGVVEPIRSSLNSVNLFSQNNESLQKMMLLLPNKNRQVTESAVVDGKSGVNGNSIFASEKKYLKQSFESLQLSRLQSQPDISYIRVEASRLSMIPSKDVERRFKKEQIKTIVV